MRRLTSWSIVCFLLQICLGCNIPKWHSETGIINTDLLPVAIGLKGMNAIQAGVKLEDEVYRGDLFAIDIGAGPSIIRPFDSDKGQGIFFDTSTRFRLIRWREIEPFLMWNLGAGWFDDWEPQATDWGFVLQVAAGVRIPRTTRPENSEWVTIDYRWWHESNGTKVFGHGHQPNPGFDGGAIFIGYSVKH